MHGVKQTTYRAYADIYDAFKGDRSSTAFLLADLIKEYRPQSHLLLDLACGTGSIAQHLAESFSVVGIDNSDRMLKIARHKAPDMQFVHGNMELFRLGQHFDVVYCIHNSVNHLLRFQQWKNAFHTIAEHLVEGGIFIFDINPVDKMEYLVTLGPSIKQVGEDYVVTQVIKGSRDHLYTWDVKVIIKKRHGYSLKHEPIVVSSYPEQMIINALNDEFKVLRCFEPASSEIPDDIGRLYYICKK
jgi:SAM-dependent methyltransferase